MIQTATNVRAPMVGIGPLAAHAQYPTMWASLSSLNCEASVKDQALILTLWSTTMKRQASYPTLERNTPKSSMTRVFTNGTFLWQTTRGYQPSLIPMFRLWLLESMFGE